ncbi:MAG: acyl-CoA-binding protein [Kofleriaceae bacterium]|nr:acyl-CoA-binding protein [Kofleriaceae bacterium]
MSETAAAFAAAQVKIKTVSSLGTDVLLNLYALYKQGSAGDVAGSRPGMLDIKGRAKFDAWAGKKGQSQAQAQAAYVALVEKLTQGK